MRPKSAIAVRQPGPSRVPAARARPRPVSAYNRVGGGAGSPQSPTSPTTVAFARLLESHQKHLERQQGGPRRPVSAGTVRTESAPNVPHPAGGIAPGKRIKTTKSSPALSHVPPSSVGGYEFLTELGKGSYGVVYKVRDKEDGKVYACKKVKVNHLDQNKQMAALDEVLNLRRVNHRNIVSLYAAFVEGNYLYIIMQWAERGDLSKLIKRLAAERGRVAEIDIWAYFWELCQGIQHLHEHRIIHRDLKGLNVFLTKTNEIKIGDLGVSRMLRTETSQLERKVGTPLYLPPELVRNQPYDLKADIWTLGVLLYHLIALRAPFRGADNRRLADAIVREKPAPLPFVYSHQLTSLVLKLLEKDPTKRMSIGEVISAFPESLRTFFTKRQEGRACSEPLPKLQVSKLKALVKELRETSHTRAASAPVNVARPVSHYGRLEQGRGVSVADLPTPAVPEEKQRDGAPPKADPPSRIKSARAPASDAVAPVTHAVPLATSAKRAVRPATANPSSRDVGGSGVQRARQVQVKQFSMESWRKQAMVHHNPRPVAVAAARRSPVHFAPAMRGDVRSPPIHQQRPRSPLAIGIPPRISPAQPSRSSPRGRDIPGSPVGGARPSSPVSPVINAPRIMRPTTAPVFRRPLPTSALPPRDEDNFDRRPSPRRAQPFTTLRSQRSSRKAVRGVARISKRQEGHGGAKDGAPARKLSVNDLAKMQEADIQS